MLCGHLLDLDTEHRLSCSDCLAEYTSLDCIEGCYAELGEADCPQCGTDP